MKNTKKPIKTMVSLAVATMITSHAVSAGGCSLYTESGAAAIGNYAAGIAAEGADASIGWYNPAGLVLIKKEQVVLGGVGVLPSTQLSGVSTYVTPTLPGQTLPPYSQSFTGLQGGENAVVPSLHYAMPLGNRAVFGLSLVSPFGLSTNYDRNSAVRYAATESKFETFNVSPELGGKLTDNWSIGAGIDLQYARVHFNSVIGAPSLMILEGVAPQTIDSLSANVGDSFGVGFHAGTLFMFNNNHTRVGFNYQSSISHQFQGSSTLTGRLADPTLDAFYGPDAESANPNAAYSSNGLYSNYIDLPAIMTLSAYQDLNKKFALLGSVVYSAWGSFKNITLNNIAVGIPNKDTYNNDLTRINSTINENYHDAWRVALGANYHVTDKWMMRVGGGYDQTPTDDAHRDVRLPDSNRWALSVGSHYQATSSLGFDLGYTYLFAANDAKVDYTLDLIISTDTITATSKNSAQLIGLQAVWSIG